MELRKRFSHMDPRTRETFWRVWLTLSAPIPLVVAVGAWALFYGVKIGNVVPILMGCFMLLLISGPIIWSAAMLKRWNKIKRENNS